MLIIIIIVFILTISTLHAEYMNKNMARDNRYSFLF